MKLPSATKLLIVLFLSSILLACSSIGPSDEKVKLDAKERWEKNFYGLVAVDVLDIDDKEVLSEDRVVYKLTMQFTRTDRKLNARAGLRIVNQVGGIGSEGGRHMSQFLQSPAGTSETSGGIVVQYRLRSGEWRLDV